MKVYLVMLDKWWCYGPSSYDSEWSSCDILGIYDTFEKAKKKLSDERAALMNKVPGLSEDNFYSMHELLRSADEDLFHDSMNTFNKWYKYKSKIVEVLAPDDVRNHYSGEIWINGYTYFYYILEKEVE